MPTDDNNDNASTSDATTEDAQQETPTISDEDVTSHPKYKELQEKHSAARKGMDNSNLTSKEKDAEIARLKVLAGEEEESEPEEQPAYATKEDLAKSAWELKNASRIELVDEEYNKILSEGFEGDPVTNAVALELAEKAMKVDNGGSERQSAMSQPSTTTRKTEPDVELTEYDTKFGLTAERKRELEKEFPSLKEAV